MFSASDTALAAAARPDSPDQLLRPESSVHNTSCASSIDEANNDSDCSFSEDESEDSIDVENQAGTKDYNKDSDHSEEKLQCSSTGNGRHSKLGSSCKPYEDSKGHQDDDSDRDDRDREEGRWAQQNHQSVGCHGNHGNETHPGQKGSGCNASTPQGKQRRLTSSGEEEYVRSSCDLQGVADAVNDDSFADSTQGVECPSSPSCLDAGKVIDVHISVVPIREHTTTLDRKGSLTHIDERTPVKPLQESDRDFSKEKSDDDDYLDSDALDSNRIPSADLFKVLDTLNLSTSAIKPPTPRGERSRVRRVQSAGYSRQTAAVIRDEKPFKKGDKCSRPPSGKRAGKRNEKNKDFHDPAHLNTTTPTLIGTTEDLTKHVRQTLPGYFTEQYQKILDEQNENGKNTNVTKTDGASSSSLALVVKELTDDDLGRDEKLYQNGQTSVNCREEKGLLQMPNGKPGKKKTKSLSNEQDKRSKGKKASRSSGVFVTMDDKSELRSIHDVEDSSSGVETMSCVTDSSLENYGDTINQSNYDSTRAYRGHEDVYLGNDRQGFEDDDEYSDKVDDDDDDGGGDEGYVNDSDDDFTNLEVVAKPMPLSKSRFV